MTEPDTLDTADIDLLSDVEEAALDAIYERAREAERERLRGLLERGLTPAMAVDYYMVERCGLDAQQWAESRGIAFQAVYENIDRAKQHLED